MHRGEPLIDDRVFVTRGAVEIVESPAARDAHANRLEVSCTDHQLRHRLRLLAGRQRMSVDLQKASTPTAERHVRGDRAGLNAGDAGDPLIQAIEERLPPVGCRVFLRRQRQPHRQQLLGLDTDVEPVHVEEAADHQAGARQQHHRERELGDDQDARPAPGADAAASRTSALFQYFVEIGFRHVERRRQAEHDARAEADGGEEREDLRVHRELDPVGLADILRGGVEQADANVREAESEQTAQDREQYALDEQLPHDTPPCGAERDPHGHLTRARGRAREQQVCDVGAGDQEDERDRAHQRQEYEPDRPAVLALVERQHTGTDVLVRIGIVRPQLGGDGVHLGLCLRARHAVGHPAEGLEVAVVPLLLCKPRHLYQRNPEVRVLWELEAFRHDADHNGRYLVHLHRTANHGGIAAVSSLPHAVAEDHHGSRSRTIVFREEVTPDERRLANQLERVRGNVRSLKPFGSAAFVAHVHRLPAVRGQTGERARGPAVILEVRIRHAAVAVAAVARADHHHAIGIVDGEAANQYGVHEREHGGVDANPECESQCRDGGEPAVLHEQPHGKPNVLPEIHRVS